VFMYSPRLTDHSAGNDMDISVYKTVFSRGNRGTPAVTRRFSDSLI
jgi:hypothetical protein